MRHVQELKNSVYVVAGQVKGKTLLPLPPQTGHVTEAAEREQRCVACLGACASSCVCSFSVL